MNNLTSEQLKLIIEELKSNLLNIPKNEIFVYVKITVGEFLEMIEKNDPQVKELIIDFINGTVQKIRGQ